jgi:hypothetical protein
VVILTTISETFNFVCVCVGGDTVSVVALRLFARFSLCFTFFRLSLIFSDSALNTSYLVSIAVSHLIPSNVNL